MGKDRDTRKLHRNDKRARRRTRTLLCPTDEHIICVRHRHAEHECAQDVEEDDAPQRLADGHADRPARVRRLAKRHADDLGARVREARLHRGRPEPEEAARGALDELFPKDAWVAPVPEADYVAEGLAAYRDDEAGEDEHDDDEEFYGGYPELGLAEKGYVEDLHRTDF